MTNIKDRLLRREAKRILGERTASVVGELREEVIRVAHDQTTVANHHITLERQQKAHAGRLDALEFWQDRLRQSFWTRLKFVFTGSVLP